MHRWQKYKVKKGNGIILVPDYLESATDENRKRSTYPQMAAWIGALSQIAMLIVVLFGYIYTVRPVFQHQLLQEKLASAELDRLEVEGQIQVLQDEKEEVERSLHEVQNQVASIEAERGILEGELQKASERAREAKADANQLEAVIQEQLNKLEDAGWELLMVDFTFVQLLADAKAVTRDWNARESFPEYLQRHRDEWPNPFLALQSSIGGLRERNAKEPRYPDSYIDELSQFVESRKDELTCAVPPFDDLEKSFRERSSKIEEIVEYKTEEYIDNLVAEYEGQGKRLKITNDFREKTARRFRGIEELNIERALKDVVREHVDSCRSAAQHVVDDFRNLKGVTR